jgi:hypothetical protein
MGDRSKIEARRKTLRESAERGSEQRAKIVVRCASCKKAGQRVYVEMGGFCFCDECIEAAASIVAANTARR